MAALTKKQLASLRRGAVGGKHPTFDKPEINAAFQAIEDKFPALKTTLGGAIETAVPGTFTAAMKKAIIAYWLELKFNQEK